MPGSLEMPLETIPAARVDGHDIVVIGASAGGVDAIMKVLRPLPRDLSASIFVAYHMPPDAKGSIVSMLAGAIALETKRADDGEAVRRGVAYVAPPDRHLLVRDGLVRVTNGPRENRWRPSIDTLFRSAAVAYGSRVIGIVLTGMLDDGTAGLLAVKECGGTTVVQDPDDAAYPEMPRSALANVDVDRRLKLADIPGAIAQLVATAAGPTPPIPARLAVEARIAERGRPPDDEKGSATGLSCAECGGPLDEQASTSKGIPEYRCLVGHAWSPQTLLSTSGEKLEATLWAAIRMFRQRANLLHRMSEREFDAGRGKAAEAYRNLASEAEEHGARLQEWTLRALQDREESEAG